MRDVSGCCVCFFGPLKKFLHFAQRPSLSFSRALSHISLQPSAGFLLLLQSKMYLDTNVHYVHRSRGMSSVTPEHFCSTYVSMGSCIS